MGRGGKAGRAPLVLTTEQLNAIAAQVGGYTHPATHPASIIVQDSAHQFLSSAQKTDLTDGGETTLHTHAGSGLTLQQVKEDTDIASAINLKHASGSDNQDLSNLVVKETNKSLVSDTLIAQIHASGSDNQDLSGLQPKETGKGLSTNDLTAALKTNYDNSYTHSQAAHAPSNAQKNSDITKEEIEAKLTGELTSHSHASSGGLTQQQILRMI